MPLPQNIGLFFTVRRLMSNIQLGSLRPSLTTHDTLSMVTSALASLLRIQR